MTYRPKIARAHSLLLASCAAIAMSPALARAETAEAARPVYFSIPAQDLGASLNQFARQSEHQIVFSTDIAAGRAAPALQGELAPEQALAMLLAGTDLTWRRQGDAFMIVRASDPQSGSAAGDGAEQGTIQALIVTAQKREEDIQDVPIAISAFTQEDLTRSQVAGGPDLMTQVPNFTFTKTNFSGYSIQIRGIGTQAISATTDPAVAVAFNNTPFVRNHFFEQEFYDLARVEVLRGPQGTLYGRNATAGVVNVISAKPSNHFEARLSGDVSNYKSSRFEGMLNIPLVEDKAALRIAGAWTKRDGYVKNILTGDQTDGRDLWSTRVTLGLNPTDALNVNLIWEHFEENDDRLRSGKQLCHSDPGPADVNGIPVGQSGASIGGTPVVGYVSQGCIPASLYSPDSFDTPNGYALPYYGPLGTIGLPVYIQQNPYVSTFQSRNLREIETHLKPDYEAKADVVELQWTLDLPWNLTLASETGFSRDHIFSFEDYNRFDTSPGVFDPGGRSDDSFDIVSAEGVFCDPQLGCTDRLAAGDLSAAHSQQFSQEFRLSSDYSGPFNFSFGANFLRYDTEERYYVFINTITMYEAMRGTEDYRGTGDSRGIWRPGVSDNSHCVLKDFFGFHIADPYRFHNIACAYIDPNDIHHLNGQGRNYFLSNNPYHLLSYAAFGEIYYQITPDLKLTAGLRWTVDRKTAPQVPSWLLAGADGELGPSASAVSASYGLPVRKVIEKEWREPTGRIALDWKPDLSFTDDTLIYGSYVRGYKAGGANPPLPIPVFIAVCPPLCGGGDTSTGQQVLDSSLTHPETFGPEFVNAYELGTKNTVLDGRMTANLSAFYYDYTGYQISQIVDRSALNLNFDAKVWGAELELDWRPRENLRLGFKGGYENTRVADGSKAIDLMDRTAGKEGWMIFRPFPSMPSNCVIPIAFAAIDRPGNTGVPGENGVVPYPTAICAAYILGVDPLTFLPYVPNPTVTDEGPIPDGYPGYDPRSANNGQGFEKDLSGNKLPNAPKFTATLTADYTLPLANDWLMTLHTDLYYQSEAWTRIFNTPGYDKLKAYNNVNVAAIFSNEDAGWQVMAYVKNVFNRDNITGAFLNSDDTGLTTNVFLNEPRLYGLRVTKNWSGGSTLGFLGGKPVERSPFTIEVGAQLQRQDTPSTVQLSFADAFAGQPLNPGRYQTEDLDWTSAPELRLIYRPEGSPWQVAAGVRYGRTSNATGRLRLSAAVGDAVCSAPRDHFYTSYFPGVDFGFMGKLQCDPEYGPITKDLPIVGEKYLQNKYNPNNLLIPTNWLSVSTDRREDHLIVDFMVGKEVGLGATLLGEHKSTVGAGLRYADFKSSVSGDIRGIPDMTFPEDGWRKYNTTFHQYASTFDTEREFKGAGPTLSWEASRTLWGGEDTGRLDVDWNLTGGALFGRQNTTVDAAEGSSYFDAIYPYSGAGAVNGQPAPVKTPLDIHPRSKSVTVPVLDLSLGLSLEVPGVKLSTGYRWERYFNVLDAGFEEHKSYDRTIDGPYFKIAVGFGG